MHSWETQGGPKHLHGGQMLSLDLKMFSQLRVWALLSAGDSYSAVWSNALSCSSLSSHAHLLPT